MKTSEFIRGKWSQVFKHFGINYPVGTLRHWSGECPFCGRKEKFRIDDKEGSGSWICVCGAGNGWKLLEHVTGREFVSLAAEIDKVFGNVQIHTPTQAPKVQLQTDEQRAASKFLKLPLLKDSPPAIEYLHNRGIYRMPMRGVRYSAGEYHSEAKRQVPCLWALATDQYSKPCYVHVTYIEHGKKLAGDFTKRKMFGIVNTEQPVSIKLFEHSAVLGIAEGIETALSAAHVYKVPTWSTINASLMKRFVAPPGTEALYIFADNDKTGTGLAAAFECARKNIMAKSGPNEVYIRWPQKVNDFNDLLIEGDQVCEWKLTK